MYTCSKRSEGVGYFKHKGFVSSSSSSRHAQKLVFTGLEGFQKITLHMQYRLAIPCEVKGSLQLLR